MSATVLATGGDAPESEVRPGELPAGHPTSAVMRRARHRILVVDDDVDGAEMLAMVLEARGYATRIAHDGETALDLVQEFRPRVLLLDLDLPGIDGYEVARRLRLDTSGCSITLVALTGMGSASDRQQTQGAGFAHHVTKPLHIPLLEALLLRSLEAEQGT